MIALLPLGLGLLAAGALSVLLLDLVVRRAELGAALVLVAMVLQAAFVDQVPSLYLHDTRVELTDLLFTFVVGAGLARLLRVRRFTAGTRWLLLLGVMLLVALVRGVLALGIQPSVNDFRQYMQFVGAALYFATFPPSASLRDRIGRIWLAATIPMTALVCLRWLANFTGFDLGALSARYDAAIRAVNGPETFFIATAAMIAVPAWRVAGDRARRLRQLSLLLLLFVMLLDRRTVWLAVVAGVAVLMRHDRRLGRRTLVLVAAAAIVTVGVFVAFSGSGSRQEPLARSASSTGTLTWRLEGWSELVGSWSKHPANWLVGEPFGSGFEREVEGTEVDSHPHDFYIQTMLRTGVVGLLALVALTSWALRALWRTPGRDDGLLGPGVFPALLTMQLVWFVTWAPGAEQGIVTGLALAVAATRARVRPAFVPPGPAGEPVTAASQRVPHHRPELAPGRKG
ncbi:MAG TPA: O-antigen ligase family protein [Actinomycetes bacterium]|jgi:O-antigen ligase|nr:O-antigen ligase family protein [Actinomycetes bacterium]